MPLFHGDKDLNVRIGHSRRMNDALKAAGKNSDLTVYPGLEHNLDDSAARTEMLRKIGALLGSALR